MRRVVTLFAFALILVAACDSQPKKSAKDMTLSLGRAVYGMNKAVNSRQFDQARPYVADEALPAFEQLTGGLAERRYDSVVAAGEPKIDFLKGKARAPINYLEATKRTGPGKAPTAREVDRHEHLWRYEGGEWRWYGPVSSN